MKTNYLTKVENKYVFNVSLIFWHLFIALSTLSIIVSLIVFLWSVIPPFEKKVQKQAYPEKKSYPDPVIVTLAELNLTDFKQEETLPIAEEVIAAPKPKSKIESVPEDTLGKYEFSKTLLRLKELIPPSKYSWQGSGYYSYPYGERYWQVYKQEKYRQWNVSRVGVEDRLQSSFKKTKAASFIEKKQVLEAFISVLQPLNESKRMDVLQSLIDNVSNNLNQTIGICSSISKVTKAMSEEENLSYISKLNNFGKNNPVDGTKFIDYVASVIEKFSAKKRVDVIESLINSYYNFFDQNIAKQVEATDLFIPFLAEISEEKHLKGLLQYYRVYIDKNYNRNQVIDQIENDYQNKVNSIDSEYENALASAKMRYQEKKIEKQFLRSKSLIGIGAGILLIVLVAVVLVFLSIQRSVSKIEEKLTEQKA